MFARNERLLFMDRRTLGRLLARDRERRRERIARIRQLLVDSIPRAEPPADAPGPLTERDERAPRPSPPRRAR